MDKVEVTRFIKDPHFPLLMEYFKDFFSEVLDITEIDTNRPSEAVHAELIAYKKIKEAFDNLEYSNEQVKSSANTTTTTFR